MLNGVDKQTYFSKPLNDIEMRIIRSATKLFLQNGYTKTTLRMIGKDCDMSHNRMLYHFATKEDMLYRLVAELMAFHSDVIEKIDAQTDNNLLAYAMEITAQIALCEGNRSAWDLYYSAYTNPKTYELIKEWGYKKNMNLLEAYLPDWSERDFKLKENIASGIELSALSTPCDMNYSLDDKITITLDSLMRLYDIPPDKRKSVIDTILKLDCITIGQQMFDMFVKRIEQAA